MDYMTNYKIYNLWKKLHNYPGLIFGGLPLKP